MNLFTIKYADNSIFIGDPFKSDWKNIDSTKQIMQLEYILGNSCITLNGFKQYNHFKERIGLQVQGYKSIILMGRTNGNSLLIIFDLQKNQIHAVEKPFGEEYGKQILSGWQEGKLDNPQVNFKKLDNIPGK